MFSIHPDIHHAHTLPSAFYRDPAMFERVKEQIFGRTWLYVADAAWVKKPGDAYPFVLLDGVLDEPLVLIRDEKGVLHCLSNVCTHRGNLVVLKPGNFRQLRCGYHGRCFWLNGSFKSMPAFANVANFPTPGDDLQSIPVKEWMGMVFISLNPVFSFEDAIYPIVQMTEFLPTDTLVFEEEGTKDYFVNANWALYCDNYLEGFHIPFVHPALNAALNFKEYDYALFRYCNLQTGIAEAGEPCFDLPEGHPDAGKLVYAYYFWMFPNLMFNFYPWGLSLNIVEPLTCNRTKVRFRTYRFANQPFNRAANNLEVTEMEDEAVVEQVQCGIKSRFYQQGRFSPTMEKGVHHFHRLIADFLNDSPSQY